MWYNSGGPHNDVTEQPRDRLTTRERRRQEFEWLRSQGVRGIKVDFWGSDKQERIQHYVEILEDAADYQLTVNTHGSTIPRGWQRMYPNLVGMEAVFGAEQYKFARNYGEIAPSHNVTLALTRNVIGPMDYTPVTFTDARFPHRTTYGHELALSVVFENPIQHFADRVEAYRSLPDAPRTFLREVPSTWDETRLLSGFPDSHVVFARRKGSVWYVGGISGEAAARTQRVDLSFLGGGSYDLLLVRDGAEARSFAAESRTVTRGQRIAVEMLPRGGFVMRIAPRGQGG
jgi:hypothetical protein